MERFSWTLENMFNGIDAYGKELVLRPFVRPMPPSVIGADSTTSKIGIPG
jgi:hypothetical protein